MRFAWLRQNSTDDAAIKQVYSLPITLVRIAYNAAFWIFLVPFFTAMEYSTGFIVLTVIILVRLGANLYANHVLKQPEQFESYPFRA
jgi:hypothetical protein